MPCCGKSRAQAAVGPRNPVPGPTPSGIEPRRVMPQVTLYFEYVGGTGLTVQGPITGRKYRFSGPGQRVAVDGRDGPSLMAVPNLRSVKASDAPPLH
jgi:hypothetical protein